MRRNHHRKLSASIYHHAKNVRIIGILTYPKIKAKRKRGNRRVPLPFRGKRAENCSQNEGKSLGEGLAHKFSEGRKDVKTEFFMRFRRTYVLNNLEGLNQLVFHLRIIFHILIKSTLSSIYRIKMNY